MSVLSLVPSDHNWFERIQRGDYAAFEEAFRAYYPELCAFAYRYLQSSALAEEAVHDVFMQLWQSRGKLQVRSAAKAYLYGAVRHRAISLLRRQAVEDKWRVGATREQHGSEPHHQNEGPERVEREQVVAAIERVLADMPPRCRTAVILRWQREMSYAEVAEVMRISVKTVEAHLLRATKILRAQLPTLLPDLLDE